MTTVIPRARSRITVALARSNSIEMFELIRSLSVETRVDDMLVISRSAERGG
jgi:hypothetical protein